MSTETRLERLEQVVAAFARAQEVSARCDKREPRWGEPTDASRMARLERMVEKLVQLQETPTRTEVIEKMANDVAATTRSSLEMADKIEHLARGSLETLVTEVQEHNRRLEVLCKYNADVLEQAMKMADKAEKHEEATREQNRVNAKLKRE